MLFTAAIYLSLSLLVQGFERADRLLILKPKIVLASELPSVIARGQYEQVIMLIPVTSLHHRRYRHHRYPSRGRRTDRSLAIRHRKGRGPKSHLGDSQQYSACRSGYPSESGHRDFSRSAIGLQPEQTASFVVFLTILSVAIYRANSAGFVSGLQLSAPRERQVRNMLWVILATSLLILLRTVFRLAETAQGESVFSAGNSGRRAANSCSWSTTMNEARWVSSFPVTALTVSGLFSYASTHEYLFGILEYTPVIVALFIWTALPPAKLIEGGAAVPAEIGAPQKRELEATDSA